MKHYLLAGLALLGAVGYVTGGDPGCGASVCVVLEWEPPTTRENGTPLQPGDLAEYRVYSVDGDEYAVLQSTDGEATGTTVGIDLPPRLASYELSFAATAVDQEGLESEYSNTATVTARHWPFAPKRARIVRIRLV